MRNFVLFQINLAIKPNKSRTERSTSVLFYEAEEAG
jgi:hypothetical protein